MSSEHFYLAHLDSGQTLITTYEATRAGFVAAALEKNRLATPYVDEARILQIKASNAKTPSDLLTFEEIKAGLLTAAGVSDKAINHLHREDQKLIISEFIEKFLEPAGDNLVEELVYRFLLIRGDALGGKMRNLAGALALRRVSRSIISTLTLAGRDYKWRHGLTRRWLQQAPDEDIDNLRGLYWRTGNQDRTLIYNVKVPILKNEGERGGKSVDLVLLACTPDDLATKQASLALLNSPERYVAVGELKGGIDPAGADEHWKTATAALERIRRAFLRVGYSPALFFVGGAIESSMANEIWNMLSSGELTNAANLNDGGQIVSLISWLCQL